MGTKTRPSLSDKNKYYISKHRYYELKHFVQQYPEWVEKLKDISSLAKVAPTDSDKIQKGSVSDPTCDAVEKGLLYSLNMQIVDQSAKETDPVIGTIIMLNVISGDSYDSGVANVPCCREVYYELYRKFFYILDQKKNKFTRNDTMTVNEIRQVIGMKPYNDPKADELRNSSLSEPE